MAIATTVTLKLRNQSYDVLSFRYGFYHKIDAKGRPCSALLGGTIFIEMESQSYTDILDNMFYKGYPPSVPGSLEVWDEDEMVCIRRIDWSEAYICSVGEEIWCRTGLPMMFGLAITPLRLDFNRTAIRMDRRWPETGGFWEEYVEEEEPIMFVREEKEEVEKEEECVCAKYNLIWGSKVDCEFRKKVVEISKELWPNNYLNMANNLMAVFQWESGGTFKAGVPNMANSGATGLIQFMPDTAKSLLGKDVTIEHTSDFFGRRLRRIKEFADMNEIEQLDYVKRYFEPTKNRSLEFVDLYLQVLFPVSSGTEEHIVFADSLAKLTTRTNESSNLRNLRVRAYSQNRGLDANNDGVIWKSEIKEKVQHYVSEGEKHKARTFECK